jgi:phage-related protein
MPRLGTIAIDALLRTRVPARWSPDWVRLRMVEAFRIERRLPNKRGRDPMATLWPPVSPEFSDIVHRGELASEQVLELWANAKSPVYSAEIERMEQAFGWLKGFLSRHESERLCLLHWAKATAWNYPVARVLQRRRWAKTSFYKQVSTGSFIIAKSLEADNIAVS